jgi:hypothetical protein
MARPGGVRLEIDSGEWAAPAACWDHVGRACDSKEGRRAWETGEWLEKARVTTAREPRRRAQGTGGGSAHEARGGCPFIGGARCLASKEPSMWVAVRCTGRDTAGTGGPTGSSSCRSGAARGPAHGARGRTSRRLGVLPALGRGGLSKARASPDVEAAVRCAARAGG